MNSVIRRTRLFTVIAITLIASLGLQAAQTKVDPPKNPYKLQDDVQLGRQASAEVEKQLRLIRDPEIEGYITRVGMRLVESIPNQFQHQEFRYSFKVVDAPDINAFALPGGPTYVNRGLIQAAAGEGELAGVMAHETSHVALRHGTAQVAKAQKYSLLGAVGAITGAVIGGGLGGVVAQGSQMGVGAYFLRFSRAYEKQADTLGAQIMANAGYDPRDLANMFRTIERSGGGRGPEWLSSHPDPGNRYESINREAQSLRVDNPIKNTPEFNRVKARLGGMPRNSARDGREGIEPGRTGSPRRSGELPASTLQSYRSSDGLFRLSYPTNWRAYPGSASDATFAPEWAVDANDITRGAMVNYIDIGGYRNASGQQAIDAVLRQLLESNSYLREERGNRYNGSLGGRSATATFLTGRNRSGFQERVWLIVRPTREGALYLAFVAPENEFNRYEPTFRSMVRSVSINDR